MNANKTKLTLGVKIIEPKKQKVWGWPAAINFIFGGTATGFYLLNVLMGILHENTFILFHSTILKLLAPILVIIGFLTLTVETERPLRSQYLLNNLRSSWMSRETLGGGLFVLLAVMDWLFPHLILQILAAVAAMVFLISQGFILYHARAVTSWNVPIMPILFLTSGIAMGFGLILLLAAFLQLTLGVLPLLTGLTILVIDFVIWLIYVRWYKDSTFRKVTDKLQHSVTQAFIVFIGHLFPFISILLILLSTAFDKGVNFQYSVSLLAGLSIFIGGVSQKVGIILWVDYLRGIDIELPKGNAGVAVNLCRD